MPLANEQTIGGHAMAIAGYQDDPGVPGGGYFMVRNSWGETWAKDSVLGAGYARLPYEFISKYSRSAYTATAPAPAKPEPAPEPKPAPAKPQPEQPKPQPEQPKPQPGSNWFSDILRKLFQKPPK